LAVPTINFYRLTLIHVGGKEIIMRGCDILGCLLAVVMVLSVGPTAVLSSVSETPILQTGTDEDPTLVQTYNVEVGTTSLSSRVDMVDSRDAYRRVYQDASFICPLTSEPIESGSRPMSLSHLQGLLEKERSTSPSLRVGNATNIYISDLLVGGAAIAEWGIYSGGLSGHKTHFDVGIVDNGTGGLDLGVSLEVRQIPLEEGVPLDGGKLYPEYSQEKTIPSTGAGTVDRVSLEWIPDIMDIFLVNISVDGGLMASEDYPGDNFVHMIFYLNTFQDTCRDLSTNDWELVPPGTFNRWHITSDVYQDPGDGNPSNNPQVTGNGSSDDNPQHTLDGSWYCGRDGDHLYDDNVDHSIVVDLSFPQGFDRTSLNVEEYAFGVAYKFYGQTEEGTAPGYQDGDHFRTYIWDPSDLEWDLARDFNGSADQGWNSWVTGSYLGILLNDYHDEDYVILDGLRMKLEFTSDELVSGMGIYVDDIIVYGVQYNLATDIGVERMDGVIPISGESVELGFTARNYGREHAPSSNFIVSVTDDSGSEIFNQSLSLSIDSRQDAEGSVEWTVPNIDAPAQFNVSITSQLAGDEYNRNDRSFYWAWATPPDTRDASILLVDNDFGLKSRGWMIQEGNPYKDVEGYVLDALVSLNRSFNVCTKPFGGPFTDSSYLMPYETVIWVTGFTQGYFRSPVYPQEQIHFMEYLNASGNLWLIGQGIPNALQGYHPWSQEPSAPQSGSLIYDYLKIASVEGKKGVADPLLGADGEYTAGLSLATDNTLFGSSERDLSPDLTPILGEGNAVLGGSTSALVDVNNAVSYAGDDFRSMTWGFELGYVESADDRLELVERSLAVLDHGWPPMYHRLEWVEPEGPIEVFPGSNTRITLKLRNTGDFNETIFDNGAFIIDTVIPPEWNVTIGWPGWPNKPLSITLRPGDDVGFNLIVTLEDDLSKPSLREGFSPSGLQVHYGDASLDLSGYVVVGRIEQLVVSSEEDFSYTIETIDQYTFDMQLTLDTNYDRSDPVNVDLQIEGPDWVVFGYALEEDTMVPVQDTELVLGVKENIGEFVLVAYVDHAPAVGEYVVRLWFNTTHLSHYRDVMFAVTGIKMPQVTYDPVGEDPFGVIEIDLTNDVSDGDIFFPGNLSIRNIGNLDLDLEMELRVTDDIISPSALPPVAPVLLTFDEENDDVVILGPDDIFLSIDALDDFIRTGLETRLNIRVNEKSSDLQWDFTFDLSILPKFDVVIEVDIIQTAITLDGMETDRVTEGDLAEVWVDVKNIGGSPLSFTVVLEMTDDDIITKKTSLDLLPGESGMVKFEFTAERDRTYRVYIEEAPALSVELTDRFTIMDPTDTDSDLIPDWEDTDDDGDGWSDVVEEGRGTDPLDPSDYPGKDEGSSFDDLMIILIVAIILAVMAGYLFVQNARDGDFPLEKIKNNRSPRSGELKERLKEARESGDIPDDLLDEMDDDLDDLKRSHL